MIRKMICMNKTLFALLALLLCWSCSHAQTIIQMEELGGVYRIPCKVNGAKMKFIFDTGADKVCLSLSIANYLYNNGYITDADIVGCGTSTVADGSIVDHIKIIIKDIEIGGIHLRNVEAVVMDGQNAPLLLGQSAIKKLGEYSISDGMLIIKNRSFTAKSDNIKVLYNALLSYGYSDIGTEEEFRKYVKDDNNVSELYDALNKEGFEDIGTKEEFYRWLKPSMEDTINQGKLLIEKANEKIDYELIRIANAYNATLPEILGYGMTMIKCTVENHSLVYVIQWKGMEPSDFSNADMDELKVYLKEGMKESEKESFIVKSLVMPMKEYGYDFVFKYVNEFGKSLFSIRISPSDL